ncbi:MAG: preprotein translocase subunit SecG [Gammaproteobacteria bacterium]|nr:preprotein translocase subunit SecG [Gammaproteobacteria bacterium]
MTTINLVLLVHVILAFALVLLILVQHGKGADAGAAFGSGASSTVFGAAGSANFLSRATKWLAIAFFATSGGLAYLSQDLTAGAPSVMAAEGVEQAGEPAMIPADESDVPAATETAGAAEDNASAEDGDE